MEDVDQYVACASCSVFIFSNYLMISNIMVVLNLIMF